MCKALLAVSLVAFGACGIQEHNVPIRQPAAFPPGQSEQPPPSEPGTGGMSGPIGVDGTGGAGSGGAGGKSGADTPDAGKPGATPDAGSGGSPGAGNPPGSNPPAGPTIDLGGTKVPRDRAIVILHFGHSNMLGHGADPASLRPYFFDTQPRLWSYRGAGSFVPAREPTANPRPQSTAGPGMGLLRAAAALAPQDYHFISVGRGVGSATTQDWSKGGLYYDDFVARAAELKGRVTFGAAVIMLGITDRHLPANQQGGFTDRLAKIVADLRADLATPDLPVLHTDYEVESSGELAVDTPIGRLFRPQILALPMRIDRLAIVPTDMTGMQDDHHFNLDGQKLWADRAMKLWVDRGWAPWK
jgi:hypothetical protein